MSTKFSIQRTIEPEESPFDRQQRISWWDQEKLSKAKILVVGAGAIGNETLKNLALLGIGNIYIVDFDTVSTSNLSRAVLFRTTDKDRQKAEIAAIRTKEMALQDDVCIQWFHGDAVWELGTGIFREMDIVLGCLDNVETRLFVNRQCWLTNTPWIDAGIYELGGHVTVFIPPELPCYECATTKEQREAARVRLSCDEFKRTLLKEGKMPTVQVTSSIVSAIQVQETLKLLCHQKVESGKKIYFQGKLNDFDVLKLPQRENCIGHVTYPEIHSLPLNNSVKLRAFLEYVSQETFSGEGATLDYRGEDRAFVISAKCKTCAKSINFNRPNFRIFDWEAICSDCRSSFGKDAKNDVSKDEMKTIGNKQTVSDFSLKETSESILNMSLWQLGVPHRHVVAVRAKDQSYKYYELSQGNPFIEV
mgnify:CR=1 FL=1